MVLLCGVQPSLPVRSRCHMLASRGLASCFLWRTMLLSAVEKAFKQARISHTGARPHLPWLPVAPRHHGGWHIAGLWPASTPRIRLLPMGMPGGDALQSRLSHRAGGGKGVPPQQTRPSSSVGLAAWHGSGHHAVLWEGLDRVSRQPSFSSGGCSPCSSSHYRIGEVDWILTRD